MPDQVYWQERYERLAEKYYKQGDLSLKELKAIFQQASQDIQGEIASFYAKYGIKSSSPVFTTLPDGTRVISGYSSKLIVPEHVAAKYNRLTTLESQLNSILVDMSKKQNSYMNSTLSIIATDSYYEGMFEMFKGYGTGYTFNLLDPQLVNQLIHNPVNGQDFSARIWNNRKVLSNQVNQILKQGLIEGISNGEMAKRLSERMGTSYGVAKRLIDTEVTNTYNQATLQRYNDTGIVKKYEYLATLDSRTSSVCQALDGRRFNVSRATVGVNYPPMHPNCRSTTVAYFPDDPAYERAARDEKGNIYYVPASMTYAQWAKKYL